jgi:hypothetical protein
MVGPQCQLGNLVAIDILGSDFRLGACKQLVLTTVWIRFTPKVKDRDIAPLCKWAIGYQDAACTVFLSLLACDDFSAVIRRSTKNAVFCSDHR